MQIHNLENKDSQLIWSFQAIPNQIYSQLIQKKAVLQLDHEFDWICRHGYSKHGKPQFNILSNFNKSGVFGNLNSILEPETIELSIPIGLPYPPVLLNKDPYSSNSKNLSLIYTPFSDKSASIGSYGYETLVFHFEISYIEQIKSEAPLLIDPILNKMKNREPFQLVGGSGNFDQEFWDLVEQIQSNLTKPLIQFVVLNACVKSLLFKSLHLITNNNFLSRKQKDENQFLLKGKRHILENLQKYPGQKRLQKVACMNRNYFTQKFKNTIGMSPHKYYLQKRREKAITTILNSTLSLTEISYNLGYSHPSALSRDIKKEIGISAKELREFYNNTISSNPNII